MAASPVVWRARRVYVCWSGHCSEGWIWLSPVWLKFRRNALETGDFQMKFQMKVRLKFSSGSVPVSDSTGVM
ncbi:hypothetical protein DPEC_G00146100, partial [Dallia pectoralis]